jgi:hypothetical protein
MAKLIGLLGTPFFDRLQDFADGFGARLRPEIAFAVDADADAVSFHVAFSDNKHGVDLHLFGALDFAVCPPFFVAMIES